jgi:hypothetical protein
VKNAKTKDCRVLVISGAAPLLRLAALCCRHEPNVLVLVFEDLIADLPAQIPRIAKFMGVEELDNETIERVAAKCQKAFMIEHGSKFDEPWAFVKMQEVGRIKDHSPFQPTPRVTAGHKDKYDRQAADFLDAQWRDHVFTHTGCSSYQEMVEALRR